MAAIATSKFLFILMPPIVRMSFLVLDRNGLLPERAFKVQIQCPLLHCSVLTVDTVAVRRSGGNMSNALLAAHGPSWRGPAPRVELVDFLQAQRE
jgi:hypothetical protein